MMLFYSTRGALSFLFENICEKCADNEIHFLYKKGLLENIFPKQFFRAKVATFYSTSSYLICLFSNILEKCLQQEHLII